VVRGELRFGGLCKGGWSSQAGVTTVNADSVLLLNGRLVRRPFSLVAAWLLVDDKPYPARLNLRDSSFVATLPASELRSGRHVVTAYIMYDRPISIARIAPGVAFEVRSTRTRNPYLAIPPAACNDPLRELAGT
jgi:hypothetical protein